jgi:hypothetical protein
MKTRRIEHAGTARSGLRLAWAAVALAAMSCHTAEGVKQDTKSALDATGRALEKTAAKIDRPKPTDRKPDAENGGKTAK